jgi:hypothetical protein
MQHLIILPPPSTQPTIPDDALITAGTASAWCPCCFGGTVSIKRAQAAWLKQQRA